MYGLGHVGHYRQEPMLTDPSLRYGPSETSVIASIGTKVDVNGKEVNSDTSNIGHSVGGRNWVVDSRNPNKLSGIGAIGELVVEGMSFNLFDARSDHVLLDILNRPKVTMLLVGISITQEKLHMHSSTS